MLRIREYPVGHASFAGRADSSDGAPPMPEPPLALRRLTASAIALGSLLIAWPAPAIEVGAGEVQGSLDTTISHGITWRVGARDEGRVGNFLSANSNDGNLNYDRGIVSNTSKFTTDLDLGYRNFGAFVRATGFIDFENENGMRARTPLSEEARDLVGQDLDLLDAYVTGAFDVGDAAVDLRVGRQVLNWGESTFITNGINAFNRFDVSKLRLPGSELREALAPIPMVSLSVAPTYNLSMEGFYQLDWEETVIDPVGSYFSTTDYVGAGAREVVIVDPSFEYLLDQPFGSDVDRCFDFSGLIRQDNWGFDLDLTPAINADLSPVFRNPKIYPEYTANECQPGLDPDPDFMTVPRGSDRKPKDSGQWGLALRYLAEDLNDTEFGFYLANYHSRLPLLRARTGSRDGIRAGLAAARAVGAPGSHTVGALAGRLISIVTEQVMVAVQAGLIPAADAPALIQQAVQEQVQQQLRPLVARGIAPPLAIDRYAKTGHYFHEYPENIRLLGLSFNTALGTSGWALQGDYALHLDAPLQRAERTLIEEGLNPMVMALGLAGCAGNPTGEDCPRHPATGEALPSEYFDTLLNDHIMNHRPGDVRGYVRHDVSQIQATATKYFGPVLGADGLVFVTEAAVMHVHSMPNRKTHPLEGPARASTVGDDIDEDGIPDGDADAHATSWGYRMAARLDYNNAVGAVNLFPYVQWRHDVGGNSPSPSGSFSEGLTALTLGMRADYLSTWQANVGYTRYGGRRNTLRDRDFISASINYSF